MKRCKKCNDFILSSAIIDGERKTFSSRRFCLKCRPFNEKNSSKYIDGNRPAFIDSIPTEQFINLIQLSKSRSEIFDKLKMRKSGASFKILNRRIAKEGTSTDHFLNGGYFSGQKKKMDESIFVKGDRNITSTVRLRLLRNKKIEYKCSICGVADFWRNKPIALELDHIDGDRYNNQLDNLRFLCPNCHSQTDTFCRKKRIS